MVEGLAVTSRRRRSEGRRGHARTGSAGRPPPTSAARTARSASATARSGGGPGSRPGHVPGGPGLPGNARGPGRAALRGLRTCRRLGGAYHGPMMQPNSAGIGGFVGAHLQEAALVPSSRAVLCALAILVLACSGVCTRPPSIREHRLPVPSCDRYPVTVLLLGAQEQSWGRPERLGWMLWGLLIIGGLFPGSCAGWVPPGMGLGDVRLAGVLGSSPLLLRDAHRGGAARPRSSRGRLLRCAAAVGEGRSPPAAFPWGRFMIVGSLGVVAFV
ncbi:hypothetical protein QJS66_08380 [Kocuria rhizophila]|nr:hypothetical protein QJS66_08380 [Kocuria rhizophila]